MSDNKVSNRRVDRLPPHSQEAEQSAVGCVIIAPADCLNRGDNPLTFESFYDQRFGTIYRVAAEMHEAGEHVDTITLQQKLKDKGVLEQCGGADNLFALQDMVPSAANFKYYADIVAEKHTLRRLLAFCVETAGKVYEFDGEVADLVERFEQDALKIRPNRSDAALVPVKEIVRAALVEIEDTWKRQGKCEGIPTGFMDLDRVTGGLKAGELTVIAAYPGGGKTSFALNLAENAMLNEKKRVGVFSLEMSSVSLVKRFICSNSRVSLRSISNGFLAECDFPKISGAAGRISAAAIWFDDSSDLSIHQLRSKARNLWRDNKIELFVVDYLQLLNASGGARKIENRQQEVADISRGLKAIAREFKVPVVALSQLNDDGKLRESRAIGQDADNVWILKDEEEAGETYRDSYPVSLRIIKQRNGPRFATVNLTFLAEFTRFENASKIDDEDIRHANLDN